MARWIIGIDEAGRGPLAGPVAVGVVKVAARFDISIHFPDAKDSKVLSEAKREEIYKRMWAYREAGKIDFTVEFSSAKLIDAIGITKAVHRSLYKGVAKLAPDARGVQVLLDGLLHAPPEYRQETIIKGDAKEPVISLASIAAKVERDRYMVQLAKKYPAYAFEVHKGYGTKRHREAIRRHGLSAFHRASFTKRIVNNSFDHAQEPGV